MSKPTPTQVKVLGNAIAGRPLDHGREPSRAASAGWGQSVASCYYKGWLERTPGNIGDWPYRITELGAAVHEQAEMAAAAKAKGRRS